MATQVANADADFGDPGEGDKVTICHFPPGNPENVQLIQTSVNALDMHISDYLISTGVSRRT